MKFGILMSMIFGVSAIACPNLSGEYVMNFEDGSQMPVTISQSVSKGVTTYEANFGGSEKWVADGRTNTIREEAEDGSYFETSDTYKCVGARLVDVQSSIDYNANKSVKCETHREWSLQINKKNNLRYVVKVKRDTCNNAGNADWELVRVK